MDSTSTMSRRSSLWSGARCIHIYLGSLFITSICPEHTLRAYLCSFKAAHLYVLHDVPISLFVIQTCCPALIIQGKKKKSRLTSACLFVKKNKKILNQSLSLHLGSFHFWMAFILPSACWCSSVELVCDC